MSTTTELVDAYETTRRDAVATSTWRLQLRSNMKKVKLKRTGLERDRIELFALESELRKRSGLTRQ